MQGWLDCADGKTVIGFCDLAGNADGTISWRDGPKRLLKREPPVPQGSSIVPKLFLIGVTILGFAFAVFAFKAGR